MDVIQECFEPHLTFTGNSIWLVTRTIHYKWYNM